jgi:cytochrome c biogenesis protein CcmG/thiol:disulfide interchange protein DsbE
VSPASPVSPSSSVSPASPVNSVSSVITEDPGELSGRARRGHTTRWVALSVLVVVAGLVAVLATSSDAAQQASSALVGKPAPGIAAAPLGAVTTVAGTSFKMSSLEGRWVVVNFFASWCPPCQQEEPQLVAFAHDHVGTGAPTLLGIVYDDSASNALSFMRSSRATWPAVVDPGALKIAYGVTGPPETFVVAPTGVVLAHYIGPVTTAALNQVIASGVAAGY